MAQKIGNKLGGGCMVLFALPFAAVGVGATGLILWSLMTWAAMQRWEEMPAMIHTADLVVNRGSDSTSYNVKASYSYEWEGTTYQGDRVAISSSSDNIGHFHQRAHQELEQHKERKEPFRCYVNPRNPHESVLYRNLRIEILGFMLIFALAFGGAGFGLLAAAIYGTKINRENEALQQQYPQEPWRWKKEWDTGVIHSHGKAKMIGMLVFACFWNLVSLPVVIIALWEEIPKGNYVALIALLFPAVGLGLAAVAVYFVLQWRRYGDTVFQMASVPGVLGGRLHGLIRIPRIILPENEVSITLDCIRRRTSGSGKNRSTHESILWQFEKSLPKNGLFQESCATAIPIDIPIPVDQPGSDESDSNNELIWRLRAKAEVPGVDYSASFDVPVFQTADSDATMTTSALNAGIITTVVDEDGQEITYYEPADAAQTGDALRRAGLRMEPCVGGGIGIVFPMLRQPGLAVGMLLFLVIWGGAIGVMVHLDAPLLFPIVFGLFFVLLLLFAIDLWVGKSRVEITHSGVRIQGGPFGIGAVRQLSFDAIDAIDMKNTMQSGNKMYYTVFLKTRAGKKVNVAGRLQQKEARAVMDALRTAISDYTT